MLSEQSANLDTSAFFLQELPKEQIRSLQMFLSDCHHLTAGFYCEGRLGSDWASFSVHTSERNVWPRMNHRLIFDPHH